MNLERAIKTIENVCGFDDNTTAVGEAWERILKEINDEVAAGEQIVNCEVIVRKKWGKILVTVKHPTSAETIRMTDEEYRLFRKIIFLTPLSKLSV